MKSAIEIFHGSQCIIDSPVFGKGSPFNDYGLGFYCTKEVELAKEWACPRRNDGFANRYLFDMAGLDVLDLSDTNHNILNWLAILLENRTFDLSTSIAKEARNYLISNFLPDYKSSDVIIGYRADDSYFSFAKAFVNNAISLDTLSKAMRLGKLGIQICLKSEASFERLVFVEAIPADGEENYIKRNSRDRRARTEYLELLGNENSREAVYMLDILRQNWRNDDERLR